MSDKKIVVPQGMFKAACMKVYASLLDQRTIYDALEEALVWLSKNPIMPTENQIEWVWDSRTDRESNTANVLKLCFIQWQRIMFDDPKLPEAVKDLLLEDDDTEHRQTHQINGSIIEAYRRGKEGK